MDARAGTAAPAPAARVQPGPPAVPLHIAHLDQHPAASAAIVRLAVRGPWRLAAVYAGAGIAYAVVMTAGWLLATHDNNVVWTTTVRLKRE